MRYPLTSMLVSTFLTSSCLLVTVSAAANTATNSQNAATDTSQIEISDVKKTVDTDMMVDTANPTTKTVTNTKEPSVAKNLDIDHVINTINKQHDNASILVKNARKPSLALNSHLLAANNVSLNVADNSDKHLLAHLTAVASNTVSKFKQSGLASWYGQDNNHYKTASGETFDMNAMTAAHPTLQFGSFVKVTNQDNGKSVVVKINDRQQNKGKSVLDLSYGAAKKLGMAHQTLGKVIIEKVSAP